MVTRQLGVGPGEGWLELAKKKEVWEDGVTFPERRSSPIFTVLAGGQEFS